MARASHGADTSPVLPSSCLVSFHLISPIPLLSLLSLLSTAHRCLCSAQQFGTFRVTVSRLFYHLRAIIYHLRVAHTHTHRHTTIETSTQHLWCGFPSQKKAWLPEPIQPRSWWNRSTWVIPLALFFFSFFIFLLLFGVEDFSLFVADLK